MATKFRYPTGTRPLLMEETARRRLLEAGCVSLLAKSGFSEVVLPVIDFVEPYAGLVDREAFRETYRFTDREGDLVAVRSDFTPMLARALTPILPGLRQEGRLPLRVFYRGDVIRCENSRLGTRRELFQIGAEIVGDPTPEADLEMLQLAASIASDLSPAPLVVVSEAFAELASDPRFLVHGEEEPGRDYYTGARFWVYGADRRKPIARGGRYDSLYAHFGTAAPAVGFTFTIDAMED